MIKYKLLNGDIVDVPQDTEEQFVIDNPQAEKVNETPDYIPQSQSVNQEYTPQSQSANQEYIPQSKIEIEEEEEETGEIEEEKVEQDKIEEEEEKEIIEEEEIVEEEEEYVPQAVLEQESQEQIIEEADPPQDNQEEIIDQSELPKATDAGPSPFLPEDLEIDELLVQDPNYVELPSKYEHWNKYDDYDEAHRKINIGKYDDWNGYIRDLETEYLDADENRKKEIDDLLPKLKNKKEWIDSWQDQLPSATIEWDEYAKESGPQTLGTGKGLFKYDIRIGDDSFLKEVDYTQWDAMSEQDKIDSIEGWENLNPNVKERWNEYFDWQRPAEYSTNTILDKDGKIVRTQYFFGDVDIADPEIWKRKIDHKISYFEDLFVNLGDDYTVKKVEHDWQDELTHMYDEAHYTHDKIIITHKSGEQLIISEGDDKSQRSNPSYYGKQVANFINKTATEKDLVKLNRQVGWMKDWWEYNLGKTLDMNWQEKEDMKQEIKDDIENSSIADIDIFTRSDGSRYINGVNGGYGVEKVLSHVDLYGNKKYWSIPGEHYKFTLQADEVQKKYVNEEGFSSLEELKNELYKTINSDDGGVSIFRYPTGSLDPTKVDEPEFDKWSLLTDQQKLRIIQNFEPGKPIENPNYEDMEGKEDDEIVAMMHYQSNLKEEEESRIKDAMEKLDKDSDDISAKIGQSALLQQVIKESNQERKVQENIIKNIEPYQQRLDDLTTDWADNPDVVTPSAEDVYKAENVIIDQTEYDNAIQKIVDNNPIIINKKEIIPGQEGYNNGIKNIMSKYSLPTEEEYLKKQDEFQTKLLLKQAELQAKLDEGTISELEANNILNKVQEEFESYRNSVINDEKEMIAEIKTFEEEYNKQADTLSEKISAFQKEQEENKKRAELRFETWNSEMEGFVVLGNGKKVPKIQFEEYQKIQNKLADEYKNFNISLNKSEELIASIDDQEVKNNLVQKNYNDWEKFTFNVSSTFANIVGGTIQTALFLGEVVQFAVTQEDSEWYKDAEKNWSNIQKDLNLYRSTLKPDVQFKDAFSSLENFGEFFMQELGTQAPIFLTLAAGGGYGMTALGGMGFGENLDRMYQEELANPGLHYSNSNKFLSSLIYGGAEYIDAWVNMTGITRSWRALTAGKKSYMESGFAGMKKHIQKTALPTAGMVSLEIGSEAATTIIQNMVSGRPTFESVDHAAFSAGMFSVFFQGLPFIKGSVMASFSDPETKTQYRSNLREISILENTLNNTDAIQLGDSTIESLENQIAELKGENETIIENELTKFSNMSPQFTNTFFAYTNRSEQLKNEYDDVKNDPELNTVQKAKQLEIIEKKFEQNELELNLLKTDPAFGSKFLGFEKSTNKEDIKRKEEIFTQAKNELISEGKKDPSDETIRERARLVYNTQEIQKDYQVTKDKGFLSENFTSYNTVDEAIEAIEAMETNDRFTEKDKNEILKDLKDKEMIHGATISTKDSKGNDIEIPFQIVENMAKDDRTETRTHERGHDILKNIGLNKTAATGISNEIFQYLQNHDIGSYMKLKINTAGMNSEEVITNFMEMVVDGSINIKEGKNKTLPTILGHAFDNVVRGKSKGEVGLNLEGETDAVTFVSTLAKKIKNGTIKLSDVKAAKKTGVIQKYKDAKTEQSKGFTYSRKTALDAINNLLPNNIKTKKDFNKFIRNERQARAINESLMLPGGVINNYIRSKQTSKQEGDKVIEETVFRLFNFDPEATRQDGRKVGNQGFGEFLFSNTNFAKLDARKALFQEGQQKQKEVRGDVADDTGRTVFENTETEAGLTPEEIMIAKQETPAQRKKTEETLSKVFGIDEKLTKKFEETLTTAFGTKLPEVNSKQMRTELGKIISDRLRPIIQKKLGTELKFDEFIKNDLTPLLKFIKAEDLRQLERMVGGKKFPNGRKIFTTSTRITKKQEIIDLQKKGLIPKTFTKYAQGYNLATRLPNPNSKELLAFFRGKNSEIELGYQPPGSIKSGMLGARKDKLAELLTREIAFDQAIQVAKNVLPKIKAIESLQNRNIKENYIAELGLTLDRDPDAGSTNTDNSSVKFSRQSKTVILEQVDLITELIEDLGVRNVIDEDGNFILFEFIEDVNISAQAVATALEIHDSGVLERGESKQYKTSVYNSEVFTQFVKDALRDQGKLRNKIFDGDKITAEGKKLNEDMGAIAEALGFEIMDLMGYDVLGYYNRLMDSALQKRGKQEGISGPFHGPLQSIKGRVSNKKSDFSNDVLKDVRLMNKEFNLFGKIQKILDKNILREDKIAELKPLQAEIKAANIANIKLAKHIVTKVITLARKGKISKLSAINFFQFQTNATRGLRALTRLDLIEVLDGSQTMSENHPQYKQALEYELNKGKLKAKAGLTFEQTVIIKKLTNKGEHINPNANTMFALAELIEKQNINLDAELDLILNDHSQLLSSYHLTDLIDDGPGGRTSTAGFSRLNVLKPETLKNVVGIDGRPFKDILADRSISKLEKNLVRDAEVNSRKSSAIQQAKDNRSKYSRRPKTKGMSTFDFDDTLARTKSGVRYTIPNNTGKPMPGKKVIFLAGSAGSGKSNVVKQLGLERQGYKMVNQDISLEWLAKNSGLPTDMRDFTPEQASKWGSLQWEARDIAQRKATKFRGRGDGVVVDGTGASTISMFAQAQKYKDTGYDVQMLFVDSSLETALERNKARKERSLQDFIVERNWKAVQKNKKAFKEEFGSNFAEVNTDKLKQGDAMPKSLVNKMDKFTNSYIKGRLTAEEFASKGGELLDQGAKFDFSEFNKVVDGTPGPLLEKARNRAKKYGTKDMFVLTARPQQSAFAIQQFLKGQGLDIPIKNITGLANSTGDAKAQWMLEKFAEGYNDMYFVDDAIQNVEAVKQVLDQLDVKSKVVQAKVKFSRNASKEFNTIIEQSKGVGADVVISQAEAIKTGRHKGWWRLFVPPSAEDFKGLLYRFLGTGKQGEQHMEWFKDHLLDPFAKGIRSWNVYKQGMVDEWKMLKKEFKDVNKSLFKNVAGTKFTVDAAVRVYLWDKAGFDIPGLDNKTKNKLISYVESNTKVKQYADTLSKITRTKEGYIQPKEGWSVGTIASDLNDIVNKIGRREFLADYLANVDAIFTPENLNKIQALYGTNFRKALDNILYRMEHGTNRKISQDSNVNGLLDWINGSVGAIMFFNMRSASLQTLSTVNFINWTDNNLFKASQAFANQPQFWKDFAMLFNSAQLKQRRRGLQTDVSASELSAAFSDGRATPRKVINYLLQLGFTPTQVVDSFAIAFGGASFYRNRFNTYKKRGMSVKEANSKAMLDFQELAEETQQSSREDMISQQQASTLGRVVLAFQNTTMQYTRLTKKSLSDLVNRRGDPKSHVSRIMYYSAVQSIIFLSLQQALAASLWGDDEEEKDKDVKRVLNGTLESFLSGMGIHGKIASTIKNTIGVYQEEKAKGWNREDAKVLLELLSFSPPIGSKLRKIYQAIRSEYYDSDGKLSEELGFRVESPKLYFWASIIEAAFNIPTQRLVRKANNLEEAITGNHSTWERIQLALGWSVWELGLEDEDTAEAKERIAEKKAIEKEKEKEQKKIEKEKEKEEEKKKEEEEKKAKGIKTVRCSGIRSNGERCGNTTETAEKTWLCYHHAEFTDGMDRDGDGIKEYRCTAIKKDGNRCKNKTENKSKKCYAHQ